MTLYAEKNAILHLPTPFTIAF